MKLVTMFVLSLLCLGALANADDSSVTLTKDNTITLNDAFYGDTVANLTKEAKELDARIQSNDPIYLVLNSPGGSIDAGMELIENLSSLKRPVKTISLFSASMGFQTVQGLGERLITKDGTLMSHKAKGGFFGEFPGQLDSRYSYYLKRIQRLDERAAARTGGKFDLKAYRNLIENEYWCDGKDCVDNGFADKVVTASCDKSLAGTKTVPVFQDIFMGHTIELYADYDVCPLNTNALKYSIKIDGQPLFQNGTKTDVSQAAYGPNPLTSPFNSSFYGYGYSSQPTSTPERLNISKEELFEIQKKIDKVIQAKQNREVIKGY